MKTSSSLMSRNTIIVIIIVILAAILYFYFNGSSAPSSSSLLQSQPSDQGIGSAELTLLSQIQSLKMDSSLFSEPAYQSLQDYSVAIPPENVGRANPFAPLPGVQSAISPTQPGH